MVGYENDCLAIVHVQFLFTPSLTKKFESRTTLSCDLRQSNVRDNDGRKLDHLTLEAQRLRAVAQIEGGAYPEDVAGRCGCTGRRCSGGWRSTGRAEGRAEGEAGAGPRDCPGRAAARRAFAAATSRTCATSGRAKGVPPGTGVVR